MTPEAKLTLLILLWFFDKAIMWLMFVLNRKNNRQFVIKQEEGKIIVKVES